MTIRIIIREKTIYGEHNLYQILLTSVEAKGMFDIAIDCTIDVNSLLFAYIIITTNANGYLCSNEICLSFAINFMDLISVNFGNSGRCADYLVTDTLVNM
jgi:hypothetical protein